MYHFYEAGVFALLHLLAIVYVLTIYMEYHRASTIKYKTEKNGYAIFWLLGAIASLAIAFLQDGGPDGKHIGLVTYLLLIALGEHFWYHKQKSLPTPLIYLIIMILSFCFTKSIAALFAFVLFLPCLLYVYLLQQKRAESPVYAFFLKNCGFVILGIVAIFLGISLTPHPLALHNSWLSLFTEEFYSFEEKEAFVLITNVYDTTYSSYIVIEDAEEIASLEEAIWETSISPTFAETGGIFREVSGYNIRVYADTIQDFTIYTDAIVIFGGTIDYKISENSPLLSLLEEMTSN